MFPSLKLACQLIHRGDRAFRAWYDSLSPEMKKAASDLSWSMFKSVIGDLASDEMDAIRKAIDGKDS
jgi:hypothetical protein